jgi:hypothetical protein
MPAEYPVIGTKVFKFRYNPNINSYSILKGKEPIDLEEFLIGSSRNSINTITSELNSIAKKLSPPKF